MGEVLNSTSFRLRWNPPPEEHHNGEIRMYRVNVTEIRTGRLLLFSTPVTELVVSGLHPYFRYESVVSAVTVDEGPYSAAVGIRTHEAGKGSSKLQLLIMVLHMCYAYKWPKHCDTVSVSVFVRISLILCVLLTFVHAAPSAPPQNVSTTFVSSTSISLSWLKPDENSRNGEIRSYNISYTGSGGSTRRLGSSSERISLSGLEPFTTYTIQVAAYTTGIGPSAEIRVTTTEDGRNFYWYNIVCFHE